MKIAIATQEFTTVSGHAGQTHAWLLYDLSAHPLDGVDIVVAASAGDGFIRHMKKRGAEVLITGEALPDPRFDITTTLCKLRDLFSRP